MKRSFISLTSDFGVGTRGIGMMHASALDICPEAHVIDLRHGLKGFSATEGAYALESAKFLPVGCHVCVVDPEVGTERKGIIIKTKRGDYLIGPDNGVLIPAAERFLGGIEKAVAIENDKYMRKPVSPVFHGRDVFTPAAAWLCRGVEISEFGPEINPKDLVRAPYEEAEVSKGLVSGKIIHVNHYGSVFINARQEDFAKSEIRYKDDVLIETGNKKIKTKFLKTFGEVRKGDVVMFPDDCGRIEIAINMGNFSKEFGTKLLDKVKIRKCE
ncbi:MAG: SAM-dependent chlorinase/fluorinase [Candidatus Aenigmarchaeota archaeon]